MGEQTSEEIDIEYKLIRLVHKRKKAVRTCKCTHSPLTKIAPAPPKLVKGGMLTTDFWAYALAEKYEFQRPIHKQIQLWKAHGLTMSQGTITQGLKRLQDMQIFAGIVEAIKTRIRSGDRQKSDETLRCLRWFAEVDFNSVLGRSVGGVPALEVLSRR